MPAETLGTGTIETYALKHDKLGVPYLDVRLRLAYIDSLDLFSRQTCRRLQVTFTTEQSAEQLPLFEAP